MSKLLTGSVSVAGLYLVGEKGEKGLPGPPGRCDCDRASNAPFGSYTQRGGPSKVPAVRECYFTIHNLNRPLVFTEFIITHQLSWPLLCMCIDICCQQ